MAESMGYKSKAAINLIGGGTTTFNSSSFRFDYLSHSIKETTEIVQDEGLRGTRTRQAERVTTGLVHVAGQIKMRPNQAELENFMPFILGTASSSGTYAVADSLPDMYMMIDNVAEVNTYLLRVNRATFESSPGQPVEMTLDVIGKTMTVESSGTFPTTVPAIDDSTRQYMMYDNTSGITVNSISYAIDRFSLTIDNKITPTYMQGVTATDLEPADRMVMLGVETKYVSGTETTLFTDNRAGTTRSGSISFTNGSNTFSFTFGKLLAPAESITVPNRNHLRFSLNYQAYGVSTTKELVVALPA